MDANMIGAYGPWAAGLVGEGPARLSFRQDRFQAGDLDAWRAQARERLHDCLLQPDIGRAPEGPAPTPARPRRPACRAFELATPLRAADGSRFSQAGRCDRPAAGGHWAARSWRQQVFRLAEDRPD